MSNPIHLKRAGRAVVALAVGLRVRRRPGRRAGRPGRSRHRQSRSSSSAAPPSRTPVRRCSTATSGSPPGRRSSASGCPPSSTAPRTTTTPSPPRRSSTSPPPTTSRPGSRSPANDLTGTDLGNRTLTAGAYRYTSSAQLTGPLTLDAEGDPNAQFVFEIGSTLTTASASSVVLVNGASPCNVYWQVGSSATLGTTTAFQGNLMALTSHLAQQRRHGDRAPARPQRRGHA